MIYFIQETNNKLIKIGISDDPYTRIRQLQTGSPVKDAYQILMVMPGGRRLETDLHSKYHHFHSHGEWFFPNKDILEFINSETQEENKFCRICGNMYRTQPIKDDIQSHCSNHKKIRNGVYPYKVRETIKEIAWQILLTDEPYAKISTQNDKDDIKRLIVYAWWSRKRETNISDSCFDDYILDNMEYLDARFSGDKNLIASINKKIVKHWGKDSY